MIGRLAHWLGALLVAWFACAAAAQPPLALEPSTLTPAEKAWLAAHPVIYQALTVGDYPPFEFYGKNGGFTGISGEYLDRVAEQLGVRVERRYFESWPKALDAVTAGQADIVASLVATPERLRRLGLSEPYVDGGHFIVVRHSDTRIRRQADLAGRRIAIEEGFSRRQKLAAAVPGIQFVEAKDTPAAIRLVFAGGADAYVGNGLVTSYLLQQMELQGLELRGEVDLPPNRLSFGIRRDAPELLSLVNRVLASIPDDERRAIVLRWVPESSSRPSLRNLLAVGWPYLLALALAVSIVLAWNRSLRLQVRRRVVAEEEARRMRSQLVDMANSLPLTVFQRRVDADGSQRYTFLSDQLSQLFGVSAQAAAADPELLWRQVHPEDVEQARRQVAEAEAGKLPLRLQFRLGEGAATRWIDSASTVTLRADGSQERNGFWLDISALKEAQHGAEAAARAKSEFLANMSHEIRTPMNAIIGMAHLLLEGGLTARQRQQALKLQRSAGSLLGILNDILDFSKIEAGHLAIEQVPFDLAAVLDHWAGLLAQQADDKGLELLLDLPADLPTALVGDPLRLGQVLLNLGSNAVKFTERGEVTLRIEETGRDDCHVGLRLSLSDTGIGITDEERQRLFMPFAQADSSISRRFGGTGLGLAISRHLVELMGGSLSLGSRPGAGSCFAFEARWGLQLPAQRALAVRSPRFGGERLLVIDDNAAARRVLCGMAHAIGLDAEAAVDGRSGLHALELAQAAGRPFRIVLVSLKMPGMDGIECARLVRESAGERPPAVLLAGAVAPDELGERLRPAQACVPDVLVKPITPWALSDACAAALGRLPALEPPPAGEAGRERARRWLLQGARVLLVEDNEINQELAVELLSEAGVEVKVAADGKQALAALASDRFDAVLMDCQMPVMDGYQATRAIRALAEGGALPIIAMTANALLGDRDKALAAGMDDHIAKPIDVDTMFATLARWLRR